MINRSVILPPPLLVYSRNNYSVILSEICREGFAVEETVKPSRFFCVC